jgi:hypothetical protein
MNRPKRANVEVFYDKNDTERKIGAKENQKGWDKL